jgi:hypothetical protein
MNLIFREFGNFRDNMILVKGGDLPIKFLDACILKALDKDDFSIIFTFDHKINVKITDTMIYVTRIGK